jgi:hypothetical protein
VPGRLDLRGDLGGARAVDVGDDDTFGAGVRQRESDRAADAAGSAGDNCYPVTPSW